MKMAYGRQSNFELLRIIAMLMILVLHAGTHGIQKYVNVSEHFTDYNEIIYYILRSLSIVAVSVYVIIGAYFLSSSAAKPKKLLKMFLETSLFSVAIYLLIVLFGYVDFDSSTFLKKVFATLCGEYWFVTIYFVLLIFSPYLNKLMDAISKKEHLSLVAIMFTLFCLWQFFHNYNLIGVSNGYGLIYFIFLYILGGYIKKYGFILKDFSTKTYLAVYFLFALINVWLVHESVLKNESVWKWFAYNSPIVLLMTYCVFQTFKNIEIRLRIINLISRYVFGIYLIHEHPTFRPILWGQFGIVENILGYDSKMVMVSFVLYCLIIFIICWVGSFILTSIFKFFFKI